MRLSQPSLRRPERGKPRSQHASKDWGLRRLRKPGSNAGRLFSLTGIASFMHCCVPLWIFFLNPGRGSIDNSVFMLLRTCLHFPDKPGQVVLCIGNRYYLNH